MDLYFAKKLSKSLEENVKFDGDQVNLQTERLINKIHRKSSTSTASPSQTNKTSTSEMTTISLL